MIVVSKIEDSARPECLKITFNCKATESALVDLRVDDAYLFMLPGDTVTLNVPKDWSLKEGETVPLSRFALLDCNQDQRIRLVWTRQELPAPSGFHP